ATLFGLIPPEVLIIYLDVTDAVLEDPSGCTEEQVKEREISFLTTVSAYFGATTGLDAVYEFQMC
ncbi:hypothetical protein ADUPG1_005134, partial [Aduncisulcus paluster]